MKTILSYLALTLVLVSCRKDVVDKTYSSKDREYFNQRIGSYTIFDVFEVKYDDFTNTADTGTYQIREFNESEFTDNMGRKAIRIERHMRGSDTSDWKYLNTWYSVSGPTSAERVENNVRYVKLSYPISVDAVWNANALNMESVNNVFYGTLHRPYTLDSFRFDSTVSVVSNTVSNINRERSFREVYAKRIGMVFKELTYIDKDVIGNTKRGIFLRYKLVRHEP